MITEVQIVTRNAHPSVAVFDAMAEADSVFKDGGHTILSVGLFRAVSVDAPFLGAPPADESEWVCEMTVSP